MLKHRLAVGLILLVGCNAVPTQELDPPGDNHESEAAQTELQEPESSENQPERSINGSWRMTSLSGNGTKCITISGKALTYIDEECDGYQDEWSVSTPIVESGDLVVLSWNEHLNGVLVGGWKIDLAWQNDGTLLGIVRYRQLGFEDVVGEVVFTPEH